jgi:hypothetical protein
MAPRQIEPHRAVEADSSNTASRVKNPLLQQQSHATTTEVTPDSGQPDITERQASQQYDITISSRRQLNELQRLEQTYGSKVHDWIDERMPREAMGTPSAMHAFRKLKETPIPWNVETRNANSVQRSTKAAADTEPTGETSVPDSVRAVISSSGHTLNGVVQRKMEDRMGGSFDDVQVHTGATAANACEDINARAFTVGNHIAFNRGEYDPSSPAGQHVLAHELAHVRQQTGGAVSLLPQKGLDLKIDPDPQLESEAEATAQRVMKGTQLGIQRLEQTDIHLQRLPGVGDSKVPPEYRSLLNSNQEVEERTKRLRGQAAVDGKKLPGAAQQQLPNCHIGALQAGLCALGWDTESLHSYVNPSIFSDLNRKQPQPELPGNIQDVMKKVVKIMDLAGDDGIQVSELLKLIDNGDNLRINKNVLQDPQLKKFPYREFHGDLKSAVIVESMAERLSNSPDEQSSKKGQQLSQFGQSLTRTLIEHSQKTSSTTFIIEPNNDMGELKSKFMNILSQRKPPLEVGVRLHYEPTWLDNKRIAERGWHAIVIYGVREKNDTTYVAIRDSNQPDGETKEIKLNRSLLPLHTPTIKSKLRRNSTSNDYFEFNGFDMNTEMTHKLASPTSSSQSAPLPPGVVPTPPSTEIDEHEFVHL